MQRSIVEEDPDYAANILEALTTFVRPINAVSNVFGGRTLPVTYESCGEPNAFYSLGERRLILCEELVFLLRGFFFDSVFDGETDEEERGRLSNFAAFSSLAFVLYHEFAPRARRHQRRGGPAATSNRWPTASPRSSPPRPISPSPCSTRRSSSPTTPRPA